MICLLKNLSYKKTRQMIQAGKVVRRGSGCSGKERPIKSS